MHMHVPVVRFFAVRYSMLRLNAIETRATYRRRIAPLYINAHWYILCARRCWGVNCMSNKPLSALARPEMCNVSKVFAKWRNGPACALLVPVSVLQLSSAAGTESWTCLRLLRERWSGGARSVQRAVRMPKTTATASGSPCAACEADSNSHIYVSLHSHILTRTSRFDESRQSSSHCRLVIAAEHVSNRSAVRKGTKTDD